MVETDFRPDWFSKPGDTLSALMARRHLGAPALAERMGEEVTLIRGLLAGTVQIDDHLAGLLSDRIGGSPTFWHARQQQFDEALARAAAALPELEARDWIKNLPLRDMMRAGWIRESKGAAAVEAALTFFDVTSPREWRDRYASHSTSFSYRTSPTYESKLGSLAVWLRQGELEASEIECGRWDSKKFKASLGEIRKLTRLKSPSSFIPRLRAICAQAGVAVVFVPAPSGCRASGATKFVSPNKAMIILSFRYLSDDHFWFTFFHEAGHLILHGVNETFVDGGAADESAKEAEANAFSASTLIPSAYLLKLTRLRGRAMDIIKFAMSIGVSAGIVVGQMQHQGLIGPHQMNKLKRRYSWQEIQDSLN